MNMTNPLLVEWGHRWLEMLGHFLWQGLLVGAATLLVAYALPAASSRWRYRSLVVGMAVMALCPVITMLVLIPTKRAASAISGSPDLSTTAMTGRTVEASLPTDVESPTTRESGSLLVEDGSARVSQGPQHRRSPVAWRWVILAVYGAGVMLLLGRLVLGAAGSRRMTLRSESLAGLGFESTIRSACRRVGMQPSPRIGISTEITVPAVVGVARAAVLLPAALITQLPADQLEAILVHELVHLRRGDTWINLLQRLAEAFLFFHPMVWWISRLIRREREFVCDDIVLSLGTSQSAYASSLVAVAVFSRGMSGSNIEPLMVDIAAARPSISELRRRLHRILGEPIQMNTKLTSRDGWLMAVTAAVLLLAPLAVHLSATTRVASQDEKPDQPSETPLDFAWGEPSDGLSCRIIPVIPGSDEQHPAAAQVLDPVVYDTSQAIMLRVQIKNVSDRPIQICNIRYNEHWTKPAPGKSNSSQYAPLLFQAQFFTRDGQSVPATLPSFELGQRLLLISGVQTPILEPGQIEEMIVSPGSWGHGQAQTLEAGDYQVQLNYIGIPPDLENNAPKAWADREFIKSWSGKIVSNSVALRVERNPEDNLSALVWGEESDGMRAAVRLSPPKDEYPYGSQLNVEFFVQNVSEETRTFWSETWRQDDQAELTTPDGQTSQLFGTWYSGFPVLMQWNLEPGQTARIGAPDLGIAVDAEAAKKLKHPVGRVVTGPTGEYRLKYTLRIGGITTQDGEGNQVIPKPGDWTGSMTTGDVKFKVREPVEGDFPEPARFQGLLEFVGPQGRVVETGHVRVWSRQGSDFEPQETQFSGGKLTVDGCIDEPLVVDVRADGFEEERFHEVTFVPGKAVELSLNETLPTRFRVISAADRKPIPGVKVRYFLRSASKASAGPYPTDGIQGPVWATSDANGQVVLGSLCDEHPQNSDLGVCLYHFYLEPPEGFAGRFIGPLKVGQELGDVALGEPLEVTGVIHGTDEELSNFSAEWDQPQPILGGLPEAAWNYAVSRDLQAERVGDELRFKLTGLRPGKLRIVGSFVRGVGEHHTFTRRDPKTGEWVWEIDLDASREGWTLSSDDPRFQGEQE